MCKISELKFFVSLKSISILMFSFIFLFCTQNDAPPNIIVILTDDQGYADLGSYNAIGFETPNIDRLAKEGLLFTDFQVSQAVCSASRAALLTGCYAERVGVEGAYNHTSRVGLNPEETTIAEMLKKIGYTTSIIGKWHLGHHKKFLPLQQGFDEYFGIPYSNDMWPVDYDGTSIAGTGHRKSFYPQLPIIEGNEKVEEIRTLKDQNQLTKRYTERAVDFIDRNSNRLFFLYMPHSMPHVPLGVSKQFLGKSEQGIYGDVMMEIDWSVGELIKALKRNSIDSNTLVIFTSDNGPWLNYGKHAGSTGPLREGKGTMWEGGSRVPCIMWWPGGIPAGIVSDKLASTIDILPTISAVTGAPLPEKAIDGVNLQSILEGVRDAEPRNTYSYYYGGNLIAVRERQMKLVFPHTYRSYEGVEPGQNGYPAIYEGVLGKYAKGRSGTELYDLSNDLSEKKDISGENPELVKRLQLFGNRVRHSLGDKLTGFVGNEVRSIGRIDSDRSRSDLSVAHKGIEKTVLIRNQFSEQYSAGGIGGLVDGQRGTLDHHHVAWQGYSGTDLEATIDFREYVPISEISISFLQKQSAWIFFPSKVQLKISGNGREFTELKSFNIPIVADETYEIKDMKYTFSQELVRFVKIIAKNVGVCPRWHVGYGEEAWLFVDEVIIN